MAIRQYIGARYIPRFMGVFDPTQQYEALDVVDNGTGTSYIARKSVPAGTTLLDTEYWAIYGSTSGAVLNLQNRMAIAEGELVVLNNESERGTIIFGGDSYGSDAHGGWISKLVALMGLSAADYYDIHSDGSSFGGGGYLSQLQTLAGLLSADEKNAVKKIIILGGINDSVNPTYATLDAAFSAYASFAATNFPNAKVYNGFVGNFVNSSAILNNRNQTFEACALYSELSGKYNFEFISNMEYILHDYTLMDADGIHPTNDGAEAIARYAYTGIKSGSVDIKYMEYYPAADVAGLFDFSGITAGWSANTLAPAFASNSDVAVFIDNGLLHFQGRFRLNISPSTPTVMAQGAQLTLGTINLKLFSGRPFDIIPIEGEAKLADNSFIPLKAHLIINSGTIYLRLDQLGDNWGLMTNSVAQILINPITFTLPTIRC